MGVSGITANLMDSVDLNLNGLLLNKKADDLPGEVGADARAGGAALAAQTSVPEIQEQADTLTKNFQNYSGQANNMLARNFVSSDSKDSKYIAAQKKSFETEKSFNNKINSLITTLSADLAANMAGKDQSRFYVEALRNSYKAKRMLGQIHDTEVQESSEENLKEIKDNIEQKVQEAVAPKDANGNPIPNAMEAPYPAPIPEAAPASEPVADVASVFSTAPAVAPGPELALEVTASAAPAAPKVSIDILV